MACNALLVFRVESAQSKGHRKSVCMWWWLIVKERLEKERGAHSTTDLYGGSCHPTEQYNDSHSAFVEKTEITRTISKLKHCNSYLPAFLANFGSVQHIYQWENTVFNNPVPCRSHIEKDILKYHRTSCEADLWSVAWIFSPSKVTVTWHRRQPCQTFPFRNQSLFNRQRRWEIGWRGSFCCHLLSGACPSQVSV